MTLARVNDSTARSTRRLENALQRFDGRPRRVDVVAHLVHITTVPTKVDLHVNEDDCRLRWVQVSIKREGVGLGLDLGHGCAAFSSGGSLSHFVRAVSLAGSRTYSWRLLPSDGVREGLVRGFIDLSPMMTTVRPSKNLCRQVPFGAILHCIFSQG